jgi:N-acetylmuramoyl-L-alanine amidase
LVDQPEQRSPSEPVSEPVPEVIPAEHIAPEMPPAPEEAPAPAAPEFIVPSAKTAAAKKAASRPPQANSTAMSRPQRKERYTLVTTFSTVRSLIITFAAAVIAATVFMWWTSPDFLAAGAVRNLAIAQATAAQIDATPTFLPTPIWFNRIGIVPGHSGIATRGSTKGNIDPGTVCPDGFNEASVVMKVADQVIATLRGRGFTVDKLEEWDTRLFGYQAAAFISLHADSCDNFNDGYNHSGFKVTNPTGRLSARDRDLALNDCVRDNYSGVTGLPFTPGSITVNMTDYHAFHEIAPSTPAVILELGFLSYDRDLLQNHTDRLAQGIVNGLLCFLDPKSLPEPSPTARVPTPTKTP